MCLGCKPGYYVFQAKQCNSCIQNCLKCNSTNCFQCSQGYYYNLSGNVCQQCNQLGCLSCNATACSQC